MKNQKLLDKLNGSPDSISLHDAAFLHFNWFDDTVEFEVEIGEYHYMINGMEECVDDIKKPTVLKMVFRGVEDFSFKRHCEFSFGDCDIMRNTIEDNFFVLSVSDYEFDALFKLSYKSFEWVVL